jgi:16S rRNA (guanine527-N7)-methyltransferase
MSTLTPPPGFFEQCQTIGVSVSTEQARLLAAYLDLLLETNKQFNLTAIKEPLLAWDRHIFDSLSIVPAAMASPALSEPVTSIIDVGSGGGLPGIPLAIMLPDVGVTLLEATGKKARFLRTVADTLNLRNIAVLNDRAEVVGQDKAHRQRYDVATARAVGPLNVLLEFTMPLVKVGGRVLAMKGKAAETELEQAADALMLLGGGEVNVYEALPGFEDEAVIIEILKTQQTPRAYPRRPGTPKIEPL